MKSTFAPLLFVVALPLAAQDPPRHLGTIGDVDDVVLVGVQTVVTRDGRLAILTEPEPAVHLFDGAGVRSWGNEGGGPAELQWPADMALGTEHLVVLDQNQHKLVVYGADGSFRESRTLGSTWANRVFIVGRDTIIGAFVPMSDERAVVRLRGEARDTLLEYERSEKRIRLVAPGAPSFTVVQPYTPTHQWTVLSDGDLAHWRPDDGRLHFLDREGAPRGVVDVPAASERVTEVVREHWVQTAIPQEFMGQRPFEPLRPVARQEAEFPETLPAVLALLPDPDGGVWIRRSVSATGEIWLHMRRTGTVTGSVVFPTGRELLHVSQLEFAALARDEFDVEMIERYAVPSWAR